MKKKILVLSNFPAPYRVAVFKGIAEDYDLDVYFGYRTDDNRNKDYTISDDELNYTILETEEANKKFKNDLKHLKKYSMILAYDWYLPYVLKVILKACILRIPFAINCDGAFLSENPSIKQRIKDVIKSFVIRRACLCFASGEYARRYFTYYGAKETKIVGYHFTSLEEKDIRKDLPTIHEKQKTRKQLGLKECTTFITVGQFIYRKGYDILLEAWRDLDENNQLVIIGGGNLEQKYHQIILEKHYKNVVIEKFKPKETVFQYYAAADVFVLPTREDIWGLVINEAMAMGLPVICSDKCVAGLEYIENNKNGYIVPLDANKLHEKMYELSVNPKLCSSMGKENWSKMSRCTLEKIAENHLYNIHKVLDVRK